MNKSEAKDLIGRMWEDLTNTAIAEGAPPEAIDNARLMAPRIGEELLEGMGILMENTSMKNTQCAAVVCAVAFVGANLLREEQGKKKNV